MLKSKKNIYKKHHFNTFSIGRNFSKVPYTTISNTQNLMCYSRVTQLTPKTSNPAAHLLSIFPNYKTILP